MEEDLIKQIEAYLLEARGWVSSEALCAQFGLKDDRPLRSTAGVPGLCSAFAISGDNGFKHVLRASTTEWLRFKHRLRKHGIQELVRVRELDRVRHEATRQVADITFERDTGQALLAGVM